MVKGGCSAVAGVGPAELHRRRLPRRGEAGYTSVVKLDPRSCCRPSSRVAETRVALALALATTLGCAGLSDDLRHARRSYAAAAYEDALTWLVAVEADIPAATRAHQATWHYLRGMTEYRLGHRREARHYLALAHVIVGDRGVGLQPQWRRTLALTLAELSSELPGSNEP